MRASAESPRLDVRERVPSGPTGALSVLFEAEGASVSGAHVAYPSGDAVVVAETHGGVPSTFSRVTFAGDDDEASSKTEPPTCVAWAPGETRGALLVARGCEIHLCAPAETPTPRAARAAAANESDFFRAPSSSAPSFPVHSDPALVMVNETKTHTPHLWERIGRARCAAKVTSAAWTNDGLAFASAAANGEIAVWRVRKSRSTSSHDGLSHVATNDDSSNDSDSSCSFLLTPVWRASHHAATEGKDGDEATILAAGASARAPVASAARNSRDARVWAFGTLTQTLRHPAAVISARWRRDRLRDGVREDVALVTVSEDGAARVWTGAPAALGGGSPTEMPRLVQTVVAQTDPGPSGYAPALLAAHWLAWRPEPRGARRRGRDPAEGDAASEPQPPPPETPRKEKETRDEDAAKTFDAFCAAAVPARNGADFLAALGSDGAVWVWMLEGFDETDSSASARVPRAHLWRRAPMLEEDATHGSADASAHRLAAASHPAYFSATWAPRRTRRGDVAANRPTHLPESHRDLFKPRGDPPPLRVVLASPDAGALVSDVDLAASGTTRELDASRNKRVVLARSSAFRGHVDGDVVTLVRACDETGAVVSVDAGGGVRVWRWLDFCEESDDDEKEGVSKRKRKQKRRLVPVSFREGSPRGVSAAAWCRGALFLATEDHLLLTHAFRDDDASRVVIEKVASVTTRKNAWSKSENLSDRSDDQTIASLDAYDVSEHDVSGAAAKTKGAPFAALAATRRDGEVLSWALVAKQNDKTPLVPLVDGDAFSRVEALCFPGTVPAVIPAGHTSVRARAFFAARVDARGDVALATCRLSKEANAEASQTEASTARLVPRWTDAGCLRRLKTSSEEESERKTELSTTLASSPTGVAVALALPDGRVEVWEAESDARGAFALAAEFQIGSDERNPGAAFFGKCHLSWFDLGGGAEALAIARGARVEVRVARREQWRVLAHANLSRDSLETNGEADPREEGPSRGGEVLSVGGLAWSAFGDALVVGVDHELVTLALSSGASLAFLAQEAATALPEYHPRVLMDWLVRGETRRARAAARRVVERLRGGDGDSNSNGSSDDGGPFSVAQNASVAQLLEDRVDVVSGDAISPNGREEKAQAKIAPAPTPSLVPEFDAGAFGGFAGFGGAPAPAPAPARFGFGMDLKRDSLDARLEQNSAVEDATSISVSRVGGRFRNADEKDASARFSASEAEEAASLVASRGAARSLPGLTGAERVGLLATLDALRDADGGADAAVDEAGRRFRALRRARALRDARSRSLDGDNSDGSTANRLLDQHGPRGEELAWATQSDAQDALLASFGLSSADGSRVADGPDPDSRATSWRALRMTGAPLWVRDDETLRKLIDAAARHAFAKTRDPGGENPCALLFAALGRANTLAGVFRAARDTRLADFFSRDFSLRKNREAALKNAYALLSKHRYLFASAFFVLAGQPQDAAALVWKHAGDLSLAVAVARLAKDASLDGEISREVSSRSGAESRDGARDEKKLGGHSSNDDGTLSASAFAGFGDFADHGASPLDGRVARLSPDRTPGAIKITEEDANEEAPREKKEKKEEAPLPASLSPAAKAFLKARVVPDFEARFAASRGKNVEDAWTLAALRWLCGDGDASVETLRRLVRDESASSEDKASAADLCAFVSRRRALLETAPALARDAADAAADATGALALALEAEGMPLAALERQARFPNENERPDADDGSARFRGFAERNAELNAFPFGAIAASAATRARADVIARLTATALAPETLPGTFPEASFRALARLLAPAKNAFDESAEAAARASLARRDASLAFSVASAEKTRRGPEEREARRLSEFLEPADLFAATEKALDSALDGEDSALDPDAKESSRRLPSVDLDPESAKRFFSRDAGADAEASREKKNADADANATPRTAKKVSGLKRLRDRLSVKIRGGASPRSPGGGGDGDGASPVGFDFSSPPDTPASPTSPAATPPPPSGFDVLMPGFGVSVLAETPAHAAPPSVAADAAGPDGSKRNEQQGEPDGFREPLPSRDAGGVFRRARDPSAFVHARCLRTPVEIARLQGDAFYGACVNPAVPHQFGLACVKKGLVIADLRALAAQGSARAPDGRAVVGAAAVLRVASASSTLARLWGDPLDGRLNAGGLDGIAPWPRAAWWHPKRQARREMQSVGSRVGAGSHLHSASDWTTAASSVAAAAAGAAASAASAIGALELDGIVGAETSANAPCSFRVPNDVVARCVEAHPREPVLIAGDAFGSVSIWRFAADISGDTTGSAFLGAVRLPDARLRGFGGAEVSPSASSVSYATRFDRRGSGEARRQHKKYGSGNATLSATTNFEARGGGQTSCAAWGPGGARFAAGGADGAVAVWRSDQFLDPSTAPASFRAPPHPGKSRVEAVSFASAAVVAAVGSHLAGGTRSNAGAGADAASLVLWDTLRSSAAPPAAAVAAHEGGATALCWLPGLAHGASPWPLVATAGRDGDIAAHDLRKLGDAGAATTVLWRARRVESGVGHAAAVKSLAALSLRNETVALVSGCKDGDVRVWECASGAHVQHLAAAHERHTFLAPRGGGRNVLQVGVSKLTPLAGGVLSCGGDGTVKLFRLAPEASDADEPLM